MTQSATLMPNPAVRSKLAQEPVFILPVEKLATLPVEKLNTAETYYMNTLEHLCGKQVWAILDALQATQNEQLNRKRAKEAELAAEKEKAERFVNAALRAKKASIV